MIECAAPGMIETRQLGSRPATWSIHTRGHRSSSEPLITSVLAVTSGSTSSIGYCSISGSTRENHRTPHKAYAWSASTATRGGSLRAACRNRRPATPR